MFMESGDLLRGRADGGRGAPVPSSSDDPPLLMSQLPQSVFPKDVPGQEAR